MTGLSARTEHLSEVAYYLAVRIGHVGVRKQIGIILEVGDRLCTGTRHKVDGLLRDLLQPVQQPL